MLLTFVLNISYEAYQIGYLQKWMVSLAQACFHCSVAKLSTWLGMHKVFIIRDMKRTIEHTHLQNSLMRTLLLWDGIRLLLQVDSLRKHIKSCGLSKRIELVIASPLLRTMQTAVGVFGGDDGVNNTPPLMVENTGDSGRPAISSLNCPPFVVVEDCLERLIENDEDILWKADIRETDEEVAARGVKFISWLCTLKEKEIAVVTHSAFLFQTLQMFGGDCHPIIKEEIGKQFGNCELRSMLLVDRS
ncbi:hypothetical protein C4D60_Mb04t35590 [Musa balbisiana]|uniref:Phosphoglycerate mutase family protein n=1 Tax=Musa balbisiana TaxID=52838 RepID=A0A4S8KH08_MUSBA|nr:hypothetical protein C4D60_Mb04t35590 [Musa balbisiana]